MSPLHRLLEYPICGTQHAHLVFEQLGFVKGRFNSGDALLAVSLGGRFGGRFGGWLLVARLDRAAAPRGTIGLQIKLALAPCDVWHATRTIHVAELRI